jgi:trk system potassium uptake protein TrkA
MYIIVVGGGRVGYYLIKALLEEGHEVLLLEKNGIVCQTINDELGSVCTQGDGCEAATLAEIGTARADLFVAVTGDDEDNLIACQVAKYKFNVPRTIARVRNPQNEALFKKLGVDVTVSATSLILEAIEAEVPTHPLTHLMTLRDKGLALVDVKIPPESKAVGKPINELELPSGSVVCLIIQKASRPIVPAPDTVIQAEDQVIAVTPPESEDALRTALRSA